MVWIFILVHTLFGWTATTGEDSHYATINISEQPSDLTFLNTMQGSLTCRRHGQPTGKTVWLTESGAKVTDIPNIRTVQDDQLVFHNFQTEDYNAHVHSAKYRCKIISLAGDIISRLATVRAELDIGYSPVVHHQSAPRNSSAIFKCHVPSKSLIQTFGWYIVTTHELVRVGKQLNDFRVLSTGELIVASVSQQYKGYKFACISRNVLSNAKMTSPPAILFIDENPIENSLINIVKPLDQTVTINNELVLNCQATSYPNPTISWYKDGVKLSNNERIKIKDGTLSIPETIESDNGRYACVINNDRKFEYEAIVKIRVPLQFIEKPKSVHLRKSNTSSLTQQTISFECKTKGSSPKIVTWFKDGTRLVVDDDDKDKRIVVTRDAISITKLQHGDEGLYQCFVENEFESIQAVTQLVFGSTLPTATILHGDSNIIQSGGKVNITCQFSGSPRPIITWYYDNVLIPSAWNAIVNKQMTYSSSLTMPVFRTKMSGAYKCVAENLVGVSEDFIDITVNDKPVIVNFQSKRNGYVGKLYMDCVAKGYPVPVVTWRRWGNLVASDWSKEVFANGTLMIKSFRQSDQGDYQCVAQNVHGQTVERVYVEVLEPPEIGPINVQPVISGSRIFFTCTCNYGSPEDLTITWYKDGILATKISGIRKEFGNQYTANLFIEKVQPEHRGRYTCIARNRAGEMMRYTDFLVYENADFKVEPRDTSVVFGNTVSLPCAATGFPTPQIVWLNAFYKPIALDHRVKQLDNGTLLIGATQANDDGEYICKAFFHIDQPFMAELLSKKVKLQVKVPARVMHASPPITRQVKGRSVSLTCSIAGTPDLNVKWFKNGGLIEEEDGSKYDITNSYVLHYKPAVLNSTLLIKDISTADNATYECMGLNLFGSNKKHFNIFVEEIPFKPFNIRKLSSTSNSLLLSWTPGYDGNVKITEYQLEIKREKDESWANGDTFQVLQFGPYTVRNLRAGTRYTCRVKAQNKLGFSGFSTPASVSTDEKAPGAPPQNISVKAIAKDQLLLIWEQPPEHLCNGQITKYLIFYTPTSSLASIRKKSITIPAYNKYTLTNLLQFTGYKVQLQAATKAGSGPLSAPIFATTLEGVPSAAPGNLQVHAVSSRKIVVSWEAISQNTYNGVLQGYIVHYTDVEKGISKQVAVNSLEAPLDHLRVFARYQIRVFAYTNSGKGVGSEVREAKTFEDVPSRPQQFRAIPANSKEIVVTWQPPSNENGIILNYNIYFKARSDDYERRLVVRPPVRTYHVRDLKVKEEYAFRMAAVTSKGEGNYTKTILAITSEHVAARIITAKNFVIYKPIGSDVSLPCMAVGYPKPSITWHSRHVGHDTTKTRRWMAADKPKLLYGITRQAEGLYNCTATNLYGSDWNVVTLIVQVPPAAPLDVSTSLSKKNGLYNINVTWLLGSHGNSPIIRNHISYAIEKVNDDWLTRTIPVKQSWFVIGNVSFDDVVYFKMASENAIDVGTYTEAVKFVISPSLTLQDEHFVVHVYAAPNVFAKIVDDRNKKNALQTFFKPILISSVAFITLLMVLLLVASWDREERRIREPRCSRLLCTCSCRKRNDFNPAPYGEPGLLWPWNMKRDGYSDAFDIKDELIPGSEEHVEIQYRRGSGSGSNYYPLQHSSNESMKHKFNEFEPVVLFKANSRTPDGQLYISGSKDLDSGDAASEKVDSNPEQWEKRSGSTRYSSTPSIIEKYFQSQETFTPNGYSNRYSDDVPYTDNIRDSILSEESVDYIMEDNNQLPDQIEDHKHQLKDLPEYGDVIKPSPPDYNDIISGYSDISDAPRALFRKDGDSARRGKIKHRKSLDSLLLKTLEDIEEQEVLTNTASVNTPALERHVAIVRDALQKANRSYDSVSSTCSSSVGELRRAFEFGKKYGLQNYDEVPAYLLDSLENLTADESTDEFDYLEHDKLLNMLNLAHFSEQPKCSNDIEVKIPLPVRLNDSDDEQDDADVMDSEYGKDGIPALSLV